MYPVRKDLNNVIKPNEEGGTEGTRKCWEWRRSR